MKHRGKTPAIYATERRAYLVMPGGDVPRNARFIIAHANRIALAWAFDKSTHGNLDGTREPSLGGMRSYAENAEAVLQRVVDHKIEPVTLSEFQNLRHTLGATSLSNSMPDLGWRNNFNTDTLEGKDGEDIKALVERGLMEKFAKDYYRATKRGAILAGVHPDDAARVEADEADGMEAMRHAQEHWASNYPKPLVLSAWLRLQAQEALMLAADVADMCSIESDLELIDSIALDVMRRNALEEAARLLVRAELMHRAIASNGPRG